MTLVYSRAEEMRWNRHDTMALTAMHIARFTGLPVVSYEDAARAAGRASVCALSHGMGLDGPGVRRGWREGTAGGPCDGGRCGGGAISIGAAPSADRLKAYGNQVGKPDSRRLSAVF